MKKIYNFVIKYSIYALVFLLPLFWLPWTVEIFEFNKQYLLVFLVGLALLAWLAKMIFVRKKIILRRTPLDIWVLAFMALTVLSAVFSIDKISSWLGFYGRFSDSAIGLLALSVLYFLVVNNVKIGPGKWGLSLKKIFRLFLFSTSLVVMTAFLSVLGFWAKIPGLPNIMTFKSFNPMSGSLQGLSIFLATIIALVIGLVLTRKRAGSRASRIFYALFLLGSVVLLVLINFHPAWLVLGTVMLILLIIVLWTRMFQKQVNLLLLPIILLLISGACVTGLPGKAAVFDDSALQTGMEQGLASFAEKINQFNQQVFQKITSTFQTIQSKLGDAYLKITEFFIPGYSLGRITAPLPKETAATKTEAPVIQETVEQVQELTPKIVIQETVEQVQELTPKIVIQEIAQVKEITQEKVTEKMTEITRVMESIQSTDLTQLNQDIDSLSQEIADLANQISSRIDYNTPSYAPVYIPSSGLQVSGHALLTTLNVSGSGAIGGSFSVHDNAAFGNTKDTDTTFNVYSTATFAEAATFDSSLSASSLGATTLNISGDGTITGVLSSATTTIAGDLTVQDSDGTVHFYVQNNTGNLGISTTTPKYVLTINSSNSTGNLFQIATTTNQKILVVNSDGYVGIGTSTPKYDLTIEGTTGNLFQIATTTNQKILVVNSDGYVGIGTSTPSKKLHVDGYIRTEDGIVFGNNFMLTGTSSDKLQLYDSAGDVIMVFDEVTP